MGSLARRLSLCGPQAPLRPWRQVCRDRCVWRQVSWWLIDREWRGGRDGSTSWRHVALLHQHRVNYCFLYHHLAPPPITIVASANLLLHRSIVDGTKFLAHQLSSHREGCASYKETVAVCSILLYVTTRVRLRLRVDKLCRVSVCRYCVHEVILAGNPTLGAVQPIPSSRGWLCL